MIWGIVCGLFFTDAIALRDAYDRAFKYSEYLRRTCQIHKH